MVADKNTTSLIKPHSTNNFFIHLEIAHFSIPRCHMMYKKGRRNKTVGIGRHINAEIEKAARHNTTHPTILKDNPTIPLLI